MTFDKQLNDRRTAVESKSNRNCNHRITPYIVGESEAHDGDVYSVEQFRLV